MNFIFWLLWVLNFLIVLLNLWGTSFRKSFGASTDFNTISLIVLVVIMVGSLVARYGFRNTRLSLAIIALPFLILLVMYIIDKSQGGD